MLFYSLQNIIESFPSSDIKKYLGLYLNQTQDSIKTNYLAQIYNLDFSTIQSLMLVDSIGRKSNFQDVLENHKNKIVYVDFWASWCAPCIEAMQSAKKLREEYANREDIVFIYLALNDKEAQWIRNSRSLISGANSESYLIVNPKTSEFIEELKINSIPRYLLYGYNGYLTNKNAPGPENEQIRNLINDLIRQQVK